MNSKNKHLRDTICIWVVCILAFLLAIMWFYKEVDLIDMDAKDISQIQVMEMAKERAVVLNDEQQIAKWIKKLSEISLERQTIAFNQKGGDYQIEIYNQKGELVKKIIVRSEDIIQIKYRTYKIKDGKSLYEMLQGLFQ